MTKPSVFYQFTGLHSFLIGLFPFYIPVYLWKLGHSFIEICYFIGLTGVGFCLTLWFFDRLRKKVHIKWLMALSFVIEILLLANVQAIDRSSMFVLFGFANGAYNCFFWIIQRLLFVETVTPENSGNKFGNFQIFIAIILKISVLLGGVVLDHYGYETLFAFSSLVAVIGCVNFLSFQYAGSTEIFRKGLPLSLEAIVGFRDKFGSRLIFVIDGVFLFLESYFWLISLFVLTRESFAFLGLLSIALASVFSLLFVVVKNKIDSVARQNIYVLGVLFYSGSWLLRATLRESDGLSVIGGKLIAITFCSSFFRLALNKRFFDLANHTLSQRYIILKSYYSQFGLVVVMIPIALLLSFLPTEIDLFKYTYWIAGVLSLTYITYSASPEKKRKNNR